LLRITQEVRVVLAARDTLPDGGRLTFVTTHDDGRANLTVSEATDGPVVLSLPIPTA
jgi:hypothetical protein